MAADLKTILSQKSIVCKEDKSERDVVGYFFEYDYTSLSVVFYGLDRKLNLSTELIKLPNNLISESAPHSLVSRAMSKFEINIESKYDKDKYSEDDFYDLHDKYHEEKSKIFEEWFCDCWTRASIGEKNETDAYFSVHDAIFKTNLRTMTGINQKEIENRYN